MRFLLRFKVVQFCQQSVEVERPGGHLQLSADARPFIARTVAVKLDAVAIRVAQIDGLADPMVGGAFDGHAAIEQALERAGKFQSARVENRKMIKSRVPRRRWRRAFASPGIESN